jgi:hypothetical protein
MWQALVVGSIGLRILDPFFQFDDIFMSLLIQNLHHDFREDTLNFLVLVSYL